MTNDPADILAMAKRHIARYNHYLAVHAAGGPRAQNIRAGECRALLELWQQVEAAEGDLELVSQRARDEVAEAQESEL